MGRANHHSPSVFALLGSSKGASFISLTYLQARSRHSVRRGRHHKNGQVNRPLNLNDWDGDPKLVTDAEATVQNDAAQSFQEQTKTSLGKLVEHAEGMERRLGDSHQDIRNFISLQKDARRDGVEAACRRDLRVVDPQHDMERIKKSRMGCSTTRTSGSFAPQSMQRSQTGTMADLAVRHVDCSG